VLLKSQSNIKNYGILAVVPVYLTIVGFIYLKNILALYLYTPDPVYAYLMNGVNLASGHIEVGHADHPGTPVQCLEAIIIFIKHALTGNQIIYKDVLSNPESYLHAICITFVLLLSLVTFLTGKYVLKHTGSIGEALLFQFVPMGTVMLEEGFGIHHPEALIIITSTFFTAYLYVAFIEPASEENQKQKYFKAFLSGMFIGFLISCKFTCAPLILLVPFVLKNYKERILYLLISIAAFFLFTLPAHASWPYMLEWLTRLTTHDGHYGFGQQRVLNPGAYKASLIELFFGTEILFPVVYTLISLALICGTVLLFKKKNIHRVYVKAIWGIWLSITCMILVVAKHYAFYYLIPAMACFPLGLIVAHKIFLNASINYRKLNKPVLITLCTCSFIFLAAKHIRDLPDFYNIKPSFDKTRQFIANNKGMPIIITTEEDQSSAFIEPSLNFGVVYSGSRMRFIYYNFLQARYPNSFEYYIPENRLFQWAEPVIPAQIFSKSSKVLVYFKGKGAKKEIEKSILDTFCKMPNGTLLGQYQKVYSDTASCEDIYEISADSVLAARLLANNQKIFCDIEKMASDKQSFISSDSIYHFKNVNELSQDFHHSGNNSIKMGPKTQYGLTAAIPAKANYLISASIWRKSFDGAGGIVFTAKDGGQFYQAGAAIIENGEDGWQKIEYRCQVPTDYKNDSVQFYLYYDGHKKAYFDDLNITIYPMQLPVKDSLGKLREEVPEEGFKK